MGIFSGAAAGAFQKVRAVWSFRSRATRMCSDSLTLPSLFTQPTEVYEEGRQEEAAREKTARPQEAEKSFCFTNESSTHPLLPDPPS